MVYLNDEAIGKHISRSNAEAEAISIWLRYVTHEKVSFSTSCAMSPRATRQRKSQPQPCSSKGFPREPGFLACKPAGVSLLLPFLLAYRLTANPMAANNNAAPTPASIADQTRSLLTSGPIIITITAPKGIVKVRTRNNTKTICPIAHSEARDSLRS